MSLAVRTAEKGEAGESDTCFNTSLRLFFLPSLLFNASPFHRRRARHYGRALQHMRVVYLQRREDIRVWEKNNIETNAACLEMP